MKMFHHPESFLMSFKVGHLCNLPRVYHLLWFPF
jgi:hypothetical protein